MGKRRRAPKGGKRRVGTTRGFDLEDSFERTGRFLERDEFDIFADDEWEEEFFDHGPLRRIRPRRGARWHRSDDDEAYLERGA